MNNPELSHLPSLRALLEKYGKISIFEYAQRYTTDETNTSELHGIRKKEFINFIAKYVERRCDAEMGEKVRASLSRNYAVSTAEHHGPMGHPFFFQSAILRGLVNPEGAIINLCTSHVSLGNSSYPRGLMLHGSRKDALTPPFFPASMRMLPVFHLPAYTRDDIEKNCLRRLRSYLRNGDVNSEDFETISGFINTYVLDEKALTRKTYSEQITLLNHSWWKNLFPDLPEFIPLDSEDIICELLVKHLAENTFLARMITDKNIQEKIEKNFNDISCCFDLKKKSGTYLFWHLDAEHRRHALWREGNELISEDGNFRIQLTCETLTSFLQQRQLIPSGLLVYTIFSCYYGLTCFGGFAQGDYLPLMQEAYRRLLTDIENTGEEMLSHHEAILNEDMIFLHEKSGTISTALDIQIRGAGATQDMHEKAKKTLLATSLEEMMPEILRCL